MNRHISKVIFIAMAGCLLINSANAENVKKKLALEGALLSAWRNNPDILAARKKIDIGKAIYKQTKAYPNPEVEFEMDKFPQDLGHDRSVDYYSMEGELRITQEVDIWGKRGLKKEIALDEISQVKNDFDKLWLEITRRVKQQYAYTALSQKKINLAKENLNLARRFFDQVQLRFNTGESRNYELIRAKLELARTRKSALEAERALKIETGKLNILMGERMGTMLTLKDDFVHERMRQTYEGLLNKALSQRPDMLKQQKEQVKKGKELKIARRKWLPTTWFSIFANREDKDYHAGGAVSLELPVWNLYRGDIDEARLKNEIAKIDLEALKKNVELDLYTAFQDVIFADQEITILEEAINEVNELLRISSLKYEEGELPFLAYLENLITYRNTKQEYFETLANYASKIALLEEAVGDKIEVPMEENRS